MFNSDRSFKKEETPEPLSPVNEISLQTSPSSAVHKFIRFQKAFPQASSFNLLHSYSFSKPFILNSQHHFHRRLLQHNVLNNSIQNRNKLGKTSLPS
jgi:hypothetical protein